MDRSSDDRSAHDRSAVGLDDAVAREHRALPGRDQRKSSLKRQHHRCCAVTHRHQALWFRLAGDQDALRTRRPLPTQAANLTYEKPGCSRKGSTTDRCGTYANDRAAEKRAVQDFLEALFRTRTGDPLLTMELLRQPVAAGGNGFRLFLRPLRPRDLQPLATGCNHGAP